MTEDLSKAIEHLTRYLAARDHSEPELRTKLKRLFSPALIDQAIGYAKERNWLLAPEILAEKAAREFGRRKKSHRYIQGQLRRKGLPSTQCQGDEEIEKMRQLLKGKFGGDAILNDEEKAKAYRFLKYRGFEDALIRKVLHEKPED